MVSDHSRQRRRTHQPPPSAVPAAELSDASQPL